MYEERKGPHPAVLAGAGVAFLGIIAAIFILKAGKNDPIPAPTKFETYKIENTASQAFYEFLRPSDWEKERGMNNMTGAAFTYGRARISFQSSFAASLMHDIPNGPGNIPDLGGAIPPEMQAAIKENNRPPVERMHIANGATFGKKYEDFAEKPMKPLQTAMGEGRFTEWTGKSEDGYDAHGYRASIMGSELGYTIIARCPEADWKTLKPVFEKMIPTIKPLPQKN
jgi:hypothetical protein